MTGIINKSFYAIKTCKICVYLCAEVVKMCTQNKHFEKNPGLYE